MAKFVQRKELSIVKELKPRVSGLFLFIVLF